MRRDPWVTTLYSQRRGLRVRRGRLYGLRTVLGVAALVNMLWLVGLWLWPRVAPLISVRVVPVWLGPVAAMPPAPPMPARQHHGAWI